MRTVEEIKLNLKEQSDFGKVSIIDALAAVDAAHKQGVIDGIKKAADVAVNTSINPHESAAKYGERLKQLLLTLATKIESGEVKV